MTGFNPEDFQSNLLNRGYVKPNKFLAFIPLPPGLQQAQIYGENVRDVQFFCEGSNLPGVMLGTYDAHRYSYGAREKRPVTPVVQDSAFTFFADAGGGASSSGNPTIGTFYDFFTNWIRLISNFDMSRGMATTGTNAINPKPYNLAYKIDYAVNMEVYVFDDTGQPAYAVTLRDAFPLMVQDTRLNWGESGIMRIQTIMTYTDWFISDIVDVQDTPPPAPPTEPVVRALG